MNYIFCISKLLRKTINIKQVNLRNYSIFTGTWNRDICRGKKLCSYPATGKPSQYLYILVNISSQYAWYIYDQNICNIFCFTVNNLYLITKVNTIFFQHYLQTFCWKTKTNLYPYTGKTSQYLSTLLFIPANAVVCASYQNKRRSFQKQPINGRNGVRPLHAAS